MLNIQKIKQLKENEIVKVNFNGKEVGNAMVVGQTISACHLILLNNLLSIEEFIRQNRLSNEIHLASFVDESTIKYPYLHETSISLEVCNTQMGVQEISIYKNIVDYVNGRINSLQKESVQRPNVVKEIEVDFNYVLDNPNKKYKIRISLFDKILKMFHKMSDDHNLSDMREAMVQRKYFNFSEILLVLGYVGTNEECANVFRNAIWVTPQH